MNIFRLIISIMFSSLAFSNPIIGELAPDFILPDESNTNHTLSNYRGKNVILYFYPRDNTPGCTREACSFRDLYSEIIELNTIIFGVSYDKPSKHQRFKSKFSLPFTLLSDIDGSVSKLYNADGWFFPKRKTYLIDSSGVIIQVYEKVDISNHTKDIIDFLSN